MAWKSDGKKGGYEIFNVTKEEFFNYSGQPIQSKWFTNKNIYDYIKESGIKKFYIKYRDPHNNNTLYKFVR